MPIFFSSRVYVTSRSTAFLGFRPRQKRFFANGGREDNSNVAKANNEPSNSLGETPSKFFVKCSLTVGGDLFNAILSALEIHRGRQKKYLPFRKGSNFLPSPDDPAPLIEELITQVNIWRQNPRRQESQAILEKLKEAKFVDLPVSSNPILKRSGEISKALSEISKASSVLYSEYVNELQSSHAQREPEREPELRSREVARPGAALPRVPTAAPSPPPTLGETLQYVNDIYAMLLILPTSSTPQNKGALEQSVVPELPGICPYPELEERGFHQPRPGGLLRTADPPKQQTIFQSKRDLEVYIYGLAFHRNFTPSRTAKFVVTALFDPQNSKYLSETTFRYALTAFLSRISDLFTAGRIAQFMTSKGFDLDITLWNLFLREAMNVQALRLFSIILRNMLSKPEIQANEETWNIALCMGSKINSKYWIRAILQIMNERKIVITEDSILAVFEVIKSVKGNDWLKQYYLENYSQEAFVPWKLLHVVLKPILERGGIEEALNMVEHAAQKQHPTEETLHFLISMCRSTNRYDIVWSIIWKFSRSWDIWPGTSGIENLFAMAMEKEMFSDVILIWRFALSKENQHKVSKDFLQLRREFERRYGIPLKREKLKENEVDEEWSMRARGKHHPDPFHRVPEDLREHSRIMKVRNWSEKLSKRKGKPGEEQDIPEDVRFWRQVEAMFQIAVETGVYEPETPPEGFPRQTRIAPRRQIARKLNVPGFPMPVKRVDGGLNFLVREKLKVWKMIQEGKIKLDSRRSEATVKEIKDTQTQ